MTWNDVYLFRLLCVVSDLKAVLPTCDSKRHNRDVRMAEYVTGIRLKCYPFAISFPFAALLLGLHGVAALLALGFVQVAFTIGGGLAALQNQNSYTFTIHEAMSKRRLRGQKRFGFHRKKGLEIHRMPRKTRKSGPRRGKAGQGRERLDKRKRKRRGRTTTTTMMTMEREAGGEHKRIGREGTGLAEDANYINGDNMVCLTTAGMRVVDHLVFDAVP